MATETTAFIKTLRNRARMFAILGYFSLLLTAALFGLAVYIYNSAAGVAEGKTAELYEQEIEVLRDSVDNLKKELINDTSNLVLQIRSLETQNRNLQIQNLDIQGRLNQPNSLLTEFENENSLLIEQVNSLRDSLDEYNSASNLLVSQSKMLSITVDSLFSRIENTQFHIENLEVELVGSKYFQAIQFINTDINLYIGRYRLFFDDDYLRLKNTIYELYKE